MEQIKTLIDEKRSGVYWLNSHVTPAELEKTAKIAGLAYFHIEGQKLTKKEQFLNHAALAMHFPEYFGDNWDALEDCLTDLSWIDANNYLVAYDHTDIFAEHAPQHFDTVLEIFKESAEFWHGQGKSMIILLRGKHKIKGLETIG
ncbi:MAG: barstar family protein [Pseudomonadota bacterium]